MNDRKPLYIFDLDGTLALIDHRRHFVRGPAPPRWREFFEACVADEPNWPVIRVMEALIRSGAEVLVFSGRSDVVREQTLQWLARHTSLSLRALSAGGLRMRPAGVHTPDDVLKRQWLLSLTLAQRDRLEAVFDDRDKVVAMWRAAGIVCFQVAPGAF